MKLKVRVYRTISRDVDEAWWAEVERNGDVVGTIEMCKSTLTNLIGYYMRAEIAGGSYITYDGIGRVSFSTNLGELLQ